MFLLQFVHLGIVLFRVSVLGLLITNCQRAYVVKNCLSLSLPSVDTAPRHLVDHKDFICCYTNDRSRDNVNLFLPQGLSKTCDLKERTPEIGICIWIKDRSTLILPRITWGSGRFNNLKFSEYNLTL